jgi:hypothetical protein
MTAIDHYDTERQKEKKGEDVLLNPAPPRPQLSDLTNNSDVTPVPKSAANLVQEVGQNRALHACALMKRLNLPLNLLNRLRLILLIVMRQIEIHVEFLHLFLSIRSANLRP